MFLAVNCGSSTEWIVKEGMSAPPFTEQAVDGKEVVLSAYRGKHVLLDFWYTSCGPCTEDTPQLKEIHATHRDSLVILAVSIDKQRDPVLRYVEQEALQWVQILDVVDNAGRLHQLYGVPYYPTYFLIDPNGVVVLKGPDALDRIQSKGIRDDYSG